MKRFLIIVLSVLAAFACQKNAPEDLKERVLVSIPMRVYGADTKVNYNSADETHPYSIKSGDKLRVRGADRDDITGLLDYEDGDFVGDLWYDPDEGEPVSVGSEGTPTPLTLTLVHEGNSDESSYAHGCRDTFQEAVEELSLITGSMDFGSEDAVELHQQASFLTANITFNFVGVGSMPTGETSVDVIVGGETIASGTATLVDNGAKSQVYTTSFVVALPGGTNLAATDYIEICDRKAYLANATLNANKNRNLARSIDFKPELGDPYWSDGTYGRVAHPAGVVVVGIIVYVNKDDSEEALAVTESAYGGGHALVISLRNASSGEIWGPSQRFNTNLVTTKAGTIDVENLSGYANTQLQKVNEDCKAARSAANYRSANNDTHTGHDTGWFLPSVGQWICSISDFGEVNPKEEWLSTSGKAWFTGDIDTNLALVKEGPADANLLIRGLNHRLEVLKNHLGCDYDDFGILVWDDTKSKYVFSDSYWTSTEKKASEIIRFNLGSVESVKGKYYSTIKVTNISKNVTYAWKVECPMKVRPFLAF